jgi:acyl transferase domain-containing protein
LREDGITSKLLVTSHAFHSPMMDAIVARTERWSKA